METTTINFQSQFAALSNQALIEKFNQETDKQGWTSSRAIYLTTLINELNNRDIDISSIYDGITINLNHKLPIVL